MSYSLQTLENYPYVRVNKIDSGTVTEVTVNPAIFGTISAYKFSGEALAVVTDVSPDSTGTIGNPLNPPPESQVVLISKSDGYVLFGGNSVAGTRMYAQAGAVYGLLANPFPSGVHALFGASSALINAFYLVRSDEPTIVRSYLLGAGAMTQNGTFDAGAPVTGLLLSPSGRMLAVNTGSHTYLRAGVGFGSAATLSAIEDVAGETLALSHDGRDVIVDSGDLDSQLQHLTVTFTTGLTGNFSAATGVGTRPPIALSAPVDAAFRTASFSPDGVLEVSVVTNADRIVRLFYARLDSAYVCVNGYRDVVTASHSGSSTRRYSASSSTLVIADNAGATGRFRLYERDTVSKPQRTISTTLTDVQRCHMTSDGAFVVLAGGSRTELHRWTGLAYELVRTIEGFTGFCKFSPDNSRLVLGGVVGSSLVVRMYAHSGDDYDLDFSRTYSTTHPTPGGAAWAPDSAQVVLSNDLDAWSLTADGTSGSTSYGTQDVAGWVSAHRPITLSANRFAQGVYEETGYSIEIRNAAGAAIQSIPLASAPSSLVLAGSRLMFVQDDMVRIFKDSGTGFVIEASYDGSAFGVSPDGTRLHIYSGQSAPTPRSGHGTIPLTLNMEAAARVTRPDWQQQFVIQPATVMAEPALAVTSGTPSSRNVWGKMAFPPVSASGHIDLHSTDATAAPLLTTGRVNTYLLGVNLLQKANETITCATDGADLTCTDEFVVLATASVPFAAVFTPRALSSVSTFALAWTSPAMESPLVMESLTPDGTFHAHNGESHFHHLAATPYSAVEELAFAAGYAVADVSDVQASSSGALILFKVDGAYKLAGEGEGGDYVNYTDMSGVFVTAYRNVGTTFEEVGYVTHPTGTTVKNIAFSLTTPLMSYFAIHADDPSAAKQGRNVLKIGETLDHIGVEWEAGMTNSYCAFSPDETHFVATYQRASAASTISLYRLATDHGSYEKTDTEAVAFGPVDYSGCASVVVAHGGAAPFTIYDVVNDELVPHEINAFEWDENTLILDVMWIDCDTIAVLDPDDISVVGPGGGDPYTDDGDDGDDPVEPPEDPGDDWGVIDKVPRDDGGGDSWPDDGTLAPDGGTPYDWDDGIYSTAYPPTLTANVFYG